MNEQSIIQIGKKFCGKTEFCKKYLKEKKPKRGLILDIDDEYTDYPYLENDSFITNRANGIYRVDFRGLMLKEMEKLYINSVLKFYNGTLICENPFKIMNRLPIDIIGCICTNQSREVNVIINFTSLKALNYPKLLSNSNFLQLYKTVEITTFKKLKKEFPLLADSFSKAEQLLEKQEMVKIDLAEGGII